MMKLKYSAAAVLLIAGGILVGWLGLSRFQPGKLLAALLLLAAGIIFLCRLIPQQKKAASSKLPTIAVVTALAALAVSPALNAVISYRPMYVYRNLYSSERLNPAVFPEELPSESSEVRFRVAGEGLVGSPIRALSFRTDAAGAAAFRKQAEENAESVSVCDAVDMVSADVSPAFMRGDSITQCTVYRFANWNGKECRIYIHNDEPLICCYQE